MNVCMLGPQRQRKLVPCIVQSPPPPPSLSSQAAKTALALENVPYGRSGAFAINLWMRRFNDSDLSGEAFQYLFSHSSVGVPHALSPNEVAVYLADR
jgi:hypothetical protein